MNRPAEIAGVAPTYEEIKFADEEELKAFVADRNGERRNITAGQKAMAYAFIYPDPARLKRAGSSNLEQQVSRTRLAEARAIYAWSRTKATDVLNGALPFDQVLKEMNGEARAPGSAERGP